MVSRVIKAAIAAFMIWLESASFIDAFMIRGRLIPSVGGLAETGCVGMGTGSELAVPAYGDVSSGRGNQMSRARSARRKISAISNQTTLISTIYIAFHMLYE